MHFEILVEDLSGKKMLESLVPGIIGNLHSFRIHEYQGIGRIPRNITSSIDAKKRLILDQLPRLLRGYGRTFANYPVTYPAAVIVVCDLDDRGLKSFRSELMEVLDACNPRPETRFCIAIEEGEAWFLGDVEAIEKAYSGARLSVLDGYENDSICGTWELLADAVYVGGSRRLKELGWGAVGREKSSWAEKITPYMDVEKNASPSFQYFRDKLRGLSEC